MSVSVCRAGRLEYLTAGTLAGARHCFSTRYGGVSEGALSSLNLGTHRGDAPENVRKNYDILCAAVGVSPASLVFARQEHTDFVASVGRGNCGEGLARPVPEVRDALVTDEPGVTLVVFSADCAPVLLYDPVRGAVGAAHSGWRGTAQDIAGKTARAMQERFGCRAQDLRAAIGPSIGPCCFETDRDVPDAMRAAFGPEAERAVTARGEKFFVDNRALIRLGLLRAGVPEERIDTACDCTACQPERFWSHRRAGAARGALAAMISLT